MQKIKIPSTKHRKALIIVDVQPAFINRRNNYIIKNIQSLLKNVSYNLYVTALFFTEKGSLWEQQTGWICPKDKTFYVSKNISPLLKDKKVVAVTKQTKSVFKGTINLTKMFNAQKIKEVHIVGYDTNDCVLATAYESFDLGFFTYVIEECTETADSAALREKTFAILRHVNLTNHSNRK